MKTQKMSFSIRLIDGLTRFAFWFVGVITSLLVIFFIVNLLGITPSTLNVGFEVPTNFKVLEEGTYANNNTLLSIKITKASGSVIFEDAPRRFAIAVLLVVLPITLALMFMLWLFKGFTKNVRLGNTFEQANIRHLKTISYVIAGMWLYLQALIAVYNLYMVPKFSFSGVQFEYSHGSFGGMLLFALFVWVLSHIFEKGAEIEEEHRLTV